MAPIVHRLRKLLGDRSGSILIELAVAMPILTTITLGGIEVSRLVLINQKLDRVAASTSDLVAQAETISATDISNLFEAAKFVIKPFELADRGVVIVSSVSAIDGNPPQVNWQQSGGGALAAASAVGSPGGAATLPPGFTIISGDNVIIAEVFYDYVPWPISGVTSNRRLYHFALFRPRFGALNALQ